MPRPRQLIHSEWFDHALQRLGALQDVEGILAREFYRLACYTDLIALAPGSASLRIYQTPALLRDDGVIVRIVIYCVLKEDDTVELQHIEAIEEGTQARDAES